ncbi:MAG: hypothetical protein ACLR3C_04235 [Eggerthella lenta]
MTQAVEALGYAAIRGFAPRIPRWASSARPRGRGHRPSA